MDGSQLRKLFRVSKKLGRADASALIRELVDAIVSGDRQSRQRVLSDVATRLDALEAKADLQMALEEARIEHRGEEPLLV
jgi:hypothetical protein